MDKFINFRSTLAKLDGVAISAYFRECTPRVLVVTDTLNFNPNHHFGLTQFVNSIKAQTIHGMLPVVTTASRYSDAFADLQNYDFLNTSHGLVIGRYDVLFMLGFDPEGAGDLPQIQADAIATFMQAGGGVFCTGDHETLGAALSAKVPRANKMRRFTAADTPPHVSSVLRHSTNLSGSDETEEFNDQSDPLPQHLYVNYRTVAGGSAGIDRLAHPLVQMIGPRRVLEVFPDHPHEGECRVPASLATSFVLNGNTVPEWPKDSAGQDVVPEAVAHTVSHGDGFPTGPTGPKQGLTAKLFAAIVAYDGHRANVGRVSVDATWHHFVNINLDGSGAGAGFPAFINAGVDSDTMTRMRRYYVNLATWLMPRRVRRCLRYPLLLAELVRYPFIEELNLPRPPDLTALQARDIGRELVASLSRHQPSFVAQSLAQDALEDALGAERLAQLAKAGDEVPAGWSMAEMGWAALGGAVSAIGAELSELPKLDAIVPHKTFVENSMLGARLGLSKWLSYQQDEQKKAARWIEKWGKPLLG